MTTHPLGKRYKHHVIVRYYSYKGTTAWWAKCQAQQCDFIEGDKDKVVAQALANDHEDEFYGVRGR